MAARRRSRRLGDARRQARSEGGGATIEHDLRGVRLVAGDGTTGYSAMDAYGVATAVPLGATLGFGLLPNGNVLLTEGDNHVVRMVWSP